MRFPALVIMVAALGAPSAFAHETGNAVGAALRSRAQARRALSPWERDFCADPVKAVCGGAPEKAKREAEDASYRASPYGKLLRGDAGLVKAKGGDPEAYARLVYRKVAELPNTGTTDVHRAIGDVIDFMSQKAVASLITSDGAKTQNFDRLKGIITVSSEKDWDRITDQKDKVTVLRAFNEVCHGPWPDNAVNISRKYFLVCPERLLRVAYARSRPAARSPSDFGLVSVSGHELGHSLDYFVQNEMYRDLATCLARHHNRPGANGGTLVNFEMQGFLGEITADYWGAVALAKAVEREPGDSEGVLREELGRFCDATGTDFVPVRPVMPGGTVTTSTDDGEGTHPKGTYRIRFMALQPQVRAALGCQAPPATPGCAIHGEAPPAKW